MTRRRWTLGAGALVLVTCASTSLGAAGGTPVGFGETTCATLALGATDVYSFEAVAGDVVWIRMTEETSELEPRLELYDPDGRFVTGSSGNNESAEILDHALAMTGRYTIHAFDSGDNDTGDYCLHVQRTTEPGNAALLEEGPVQCDTLDSTAEIDAWTFEAEAGDIVWIRMQEVDAQLEPRLRLYRPDGTLLATGASNDVTSDILDRTLPDPGTYTLLATDSGTDDVGAYCLHLVNISDSIDAMPLEEGPVQCDSLDSITAIDVWTFEAEAGEVVWIRMQELDALLEPRLRLYGPDGSLLATGADNNITSDILDRTLPDTGTYTLLASDSGTDDVGEYCLHLVNITDSIDAMPLEEGPVQCDALDSIAAIDVWTFEAEAGEVVWIRMQELDALLEPRLRLYGPDGSLLATGADNNITSDILDRTLPDAGTYTLLASDSGTDDIGDYCLHLVNISDSIDAMPLEEGPVQCDSLDSIAAIDVWTFEAEAGDVVWIRMQELDAQLEPRLRLYRPNGTLLATGASNDVTSDILDRTLPDTGTYTLLASDSGTDDVGAYCLHLVNISDSIDAMPLEEGPVQCDSLDSITAIDVWTFEAEAGEVVWIRMQELDALLEPRLRLYGPDGSLLATGADNNITSDILDRTLPDAGTYTLLASDSGTNEVGGYCLHLVNITNPIDAIPLAEGPVHCDTLDSIAAIDAWRFEAEAGTSARIRMREMTPELEPRLRFYDPNGLLLATGADNNVTSVIAQVPLATGGTYTLLASDSGTNDLGTYRVEIELCEDDPCPAFCDPDTDDNRAIDFEDLLAVLSAWGECACCDEDIDASGIVEFEDLLAVLSRWGPCD